MASLSTCHLGLWLGWEIWLNLDKDNGRIIFSNSGSFENTWMVRMLELMDTDRRGSMILLYKLTDLVPLISTCNISR